MTRVLACWLVAWSGAALAQDLEAAGEVLDAGAPVDAGVPAGVKAVTLTAPAKLETRAPEPPARVQVSESLLAAYHLDNGNIAPKGTIQYDPTGSNYADWLNKLQLDASWQSFSAQVRMDSALYVNAPVAAASDVRLSTLLRNRYQSRIDFEKVSLSWSSRVLDVTLGDTYVTFGRGLVLSLRKVDEFGVDTSLRGLTANAHFEGLSVTALGGFTNIVNVDPSTGRYAENPNDVIIGGHADYKIGRWVKPGLNVSHVIYAQNAQTTVMQAAADTVTTFSGSLEFPRLGRFGTLYAEFAAQRRVTQGTQLWSTALYASGSAFLGPVTLLLEFKDYRNYSAIPTSLQQTDAPELALNNFYTAMPTLERVQQLVLNNTDVFGGHVRASARLTPDVVPFVSMAVFSDRIYETLIVDPYAGVELRWNDGSSRASLSGGYRRNQYVEGANAPGLFQQSFHGEFDITQHLAGPYALELSGLHMTQREAPALTDWNEGQVYLAFKQADRWSAALGYEYYSKAPNTIRPNYVNVSGTWHVFKNVLLRGLIGGQRAGIKCVSGVCRNYPAFDGARLELVTKF